MKNFKKTIKAHAKKINSKSKFLPFIVDEYTVINDVVLIDVSLLNKEHEPFGAPYVVAIDDDTFGHCAYGFDMCDNYKNGVYTVIDDDRFTWELSLGEFVEEYLEEYHLQRILNDLLK